MSNETNSDRLKKLPAAIAAFSVVAAVLGGGYLGWSNISSANTDKAATAEVETANAELQEAVDVGIAAQQNIDSLTAALTGLQVQIPTQIDQEGFLSELSEIGAAHGISIDGITLGSQVQFSAISGDMTSALESVSEEDAASAAAALETVKAAGNSNLVALPASVTATGDYSSIADFISGVQHSERVFWVNAINISESEDKDSDGYQVVLSGYIFTEAVAS